MGRLGGRPKNGQTEVGSLEAARSHGARLGEFARRDSNQWAAVAPAAGRPASARWACERTGAANVQTALSAGTNEHSRDGGGERQRGRSVKRRLNNK
jgi:hypothetical protein